MKLYAPNGAEIVSIKLRNGTTSQFEFSGTNRHGEIAMVYTLPAGISSEVQITDGERILVDANGKEWFASDIEYHNSGNFSNH